MFEYMNYFVVVLLLGIILVGLLILLVVIIGTQKRKQIEDLNMTGEKLEKLLAESETMIEELNRFSDYVVSLMEEKDNQLKATRKYAEEILDRLKGDPGSRIPAAEHMSVAASNEILLNKLNLDEPLHNKSEQNELAQYESEQIDPKQSIPFKKGNVVPMNPKYKEILELAEYGLSDTDIAKSLQMGKGEVQLILGMKKG